MDGWNGNGLYLMANVRFHDSKPLFLDGALAMHEDCCCPNCTYCTGDTPNTVTATVSGVVWCSCNKWDSFKGGADKWLDFTKSSDSYNGVYTLDNQKNDPTPDDCEWKWTGNVTAEYDEYSDDTCTTLVGSGSMSENVTLRLFRESGQWRFAMSDTSGTTWTATDCDPTKTVSGFGQNNCVNNREHVDTTGISVSFSIP